MSQQYPELVFVAGPQTGQRIVLSRPVAVIGRGSGADILLSEDFISRRQAKYELLRGGPSLENLAERGTWINGKRFKEGKKILLETGDVVGVGRETQILFVSPGDDPDAALAAYQSRPVGARNAFGKRVAVEEPETVAKEEEADVPARQPSGHGTPAVPGGGAAASPAAVAPEPVFDRPVRKASEMTPAERAKLEGKAKRRKVVIGLGIYFGLIVIAGVALWLYTAKRSSSKQMEKVIPPEDIKEQLSQRLEYTTKSSMDKEKCLQKALDNYKTYGTEPHRLAETVRYFKQSLAYGNQTFFDKPEHQTLYTTVLSKLVSEVQDRYKEACRLERAEKWAEGEKAFQDLLAILGEEQTEASEQRSPLYENVMKHWNRCKILRTGEAPKKRGPFGW